ncbi:glycoside hydrolase family 3 C-terminal domain-containing protein [Lactonifactor longoviformis]|uniref:glycoside hydrolase family 3 C-terminal domain-containing protein n=1 Tax=Lactonifactor longoviformis TaxID=341220 RepID=UPI0036F32346
MKHQDIIEKMTLEEKAAFLSGKGEWDTRDVPRLGIPSIFCSDGPHGIRKQAGAGDHLGLNESLPATCFPTAATIANSWDVELGKEIGEALGKEALTQDVQVLLGPGLNIKRSPLCGRNFEYFSEDPYLAGEMAASYIQGIQSQGVYACPKHFAVNSQELRRMAMNAVLDERTLREIYLTGFEIAVKEGGAKAIMSSYNQVNGIYANENQHLLQDILRKEWGFDGIVITDWGGSNNHIEGVKAGSNLEMPAPGLDSARQILSAINEGSLKMEELDSCVDKLLDAVLAVSKNHKTVGKGFDETKHHQLARKAAVESAVLLKNADHILPLQAGCKVAVIGDFAVEPRYQGAGSSMVKPTSLETIEQAITDYDLQVAGISRGYRRTGEADEVLKKEALDAAAGADVVLYCFGLDELSESEGLDRSHMRIPQNQIELLQAIAQVNENIVGVLSAGASVEMPWQINLKAILHGYLSGQAGASAMLDILTGKVNPSGRLAESYPIRYEDTPAFRHFPSTERNAEYRESIYVGYRYYDTTKVRVQYPFGFGLSYTEFTYSELKADMGGATLTVTNSGNVDGAEVVQLYVGLPNAIVFRPEKELKGFVKVFLKTGESQKVHIPFDDKTFRYWNIKTGRWEVEMGTYHIMVGASVSDIRLAAELEVEGTTAEYPYHPALLPYYYTGIVQQISDPEFETLLGHLIPGGKWTGKLTANDAICQMYYARSGLARFIYNRLTSMKKKSEEKGKPDLNILFIYNMPFRALAKMTAGAVSMDMVDGIVEVVNGHFFRGIKKVIGGFFGNARANRAYEKSLTSKKEMTR